MNVASKQTADIMSRPLSESSLKRIAWAFGCAKKGTDEETALRALLIEKARTES